MEDKKPMEDYLNSLGIRFLEIKPPINSDIYCVQLPNQEWGAMKVGQEQPIIEFGKYKYLFGYDGEYCLVNTEGRSGQIHADRGIVNSKGYDVISPYTCDDIFDFYGNKFPITIYKNGYEITYDRQDMTKELGRKSLQNRI